MELLDCRAASPGGPNFQLVSPNKSSLLKAVRVLA